MRPTESLRMFAALVYAALSTAIVSSLGMLLVPVVAVDMDVAASVAQWMITANLLVGALVAPTAGRISDGPRKKALLLLLLSVTLVGSVVAALSTSFWMLMVGRSLQGFAYGLVPVAISLARVHLPREQRARAIATLSITVSMGLGFGYPLTGLVVDAFGMGAAFWLAAVFVAACALVVSVLVPGDAPGARGPSFDVAGAVWLSGALVLLVLGIAEGPVLGWLTWRILGCFSAALVCAIGWVLSAARVERAFVDVTSLRGPAVLVTHAVAFGLASTIYLAMSTTSLIAQAPVTTGYGLGKTVVAAGLVILPMSVGSIVASTVLRGAIDHRPLIAVVAWGAGALLAGHTALLAWHQSFVQLLLGMAVVGFGMGVVFGAAPVVVARGVPVAEVGSAVAFNQVLRTIGGTLGSAVAGSVFAATDSGLGFPSGHGILVTFAVATGVCALGLLVLCASTLRDPGRQPL